MTTPRERGEPQLEKVWFPTTASSFSFSASSLPGAAVKTIMRSVLFSAVRIWQSSSSVPTVG